MAKLHARPSNQYRYEHYDPQERLAGQADEAADPAGEVHLRTANQRCCLHAERGQHRWCNRDLAAFSEAYGEPCSYQVPL